MNFNKKDRNQPVGLKKKKILRTIYFNPLITIKYRPTRRQQKRIKTKLSKQKIQIK